MWIKGTLQPYLSPLATNAKERIEGKKIETDVGSDAKLSARKQNTQKTEIEKKKAKEKKKEKDNTKYLDQY